MGQAVRYIEAAIAILPTLMRALRAALYVLRHREQLYGDLLWTWQALGDLEVTGNERRKLRKKVETHLRGLGLGEAGDDRRG